jgi:hypothetical protein
VRRVEGRAARHRTRPRDLETYDKTIEVLRAAVNKANIDRSERVKALKRLVEYGKKKIRNRETT